MAKTRILLLLPFVPLMLWFMPATGLASGMAVSPCRIDSAVADTLRREAMATMPADTASARADSIMKSNAAKLAAIASPADTGAIRATTDSLAISKEAARRIKKQFRPDPNRALWLSLVLPGAGQIYNRKYWKLPFVYGGFLGCTYALMWNQQMYMDYSQAYLDIMDNDPNTKSYIEMLPPGYDITGREEQFKNIFKNKKNFYRRYRDLSAFCFIGVYLLSVIDAYVDAQLSEFDISPDLSMSLAPAVISSGPQLSGSKANAVGVGCSLSF